MYWLLSIESDVVFICDRANNFALMSGMLLVASNPETEPTVVSAACVTRNRAQSETDQITDLQAVDSLCRCCPFSNQTARRVDQISSV